MTESEYIVGTDHKDTKLVDFVAHSLMLSKKRAKALLDAHAVLVNDRRVWMAAHLLRTGDRIHIVNADLTTNENKEKSPKPKIIYEDRECLIVDKPIGRLSDGEFGVEADLRRTFPGILAVHRLDRDTSGCLIFAKHESARAAVELLFRKQMVKKCYLAIIIGYLPRSRLTINASLSGKTAVTHCTEKQRGAAHSLIEAEIETGRTHQIRKHLQSIGRAIVGDRSYAGRGRTSPAERNIARQMLHAWRIEFINPISRARIKCEAPWPADFKQCFEQLIATKR